ncbi:MAG TPA: cytochrome c oxidase subunit II [Actinomycetota bacterium]|jgi:cytochrome c oxidase subunit 2|nr:cytochrome c oxidase subunit II [Actinomycetota bacterium]
MLVASGCVSNRSNITRPAGSAAHHVANDWTYLIWTSVAVLAIITILLLWAVVFRRNRGPNPARNPRGGVWLIVVGGVMLPVMLLSTEWALSNVTLASIADPGKPALTITVIGHQWWWELRYPAPGGGTFTTANEIHVPVGVPVRFVLRSADVNHSFWVPELAGKTDLIAGRVNGFTTTVTTPGTYYGQCAEFCGLQHAHMLILVVAQPQAAFQSWLANQAAPAPTPRSPSLQQGEQVFVNGPCSACHTIRGTPADGTVGPDLTHVGSRQRLAANSVPNTPGYLGGWISDSQTIKPGNLMPPIALAPKNLQDVISYLESLK